MSAIKFIQQHGVDRAREVVGGAPTVYIGTEKAWLCYRAKDNKYSTRFKHSNLLVNISSLKRVVESVDIITKVGGIREAVEEHTRWMHAPELHLYRIGESVERLKQAIADYEAIGGEHV